jgi:hypothetical protein
MFSTSEDGLNILKDRNYTIACLLDAHNKFSIPPANGEAARHTLITEVVSMSTVEPAQQNASSSHSQQSSSLPSSSQPQQPSTSSAEVLCIDGEDEAGAEEDNSSQPPHEDFNEKALYTQWKQVQANILKQAAPTPAEQEGYTRAMKRREVEQYLAEAPLDPAISNVAYWRTKQAMWPTLAKLALKYCIVPASSVYSERLFSEFGNVYDERRSRLQPDASEQLVFLHHNLPRFHNNGRKPHVSCIVSEEYEELPAGVAEEDEDDVQGENEEEEEDEDN